MARWRLYLPAASIPCWMLKLMIFTAPSASPPRGRIATTAVAASTTTSTRCRRMLVAARFWFVADLFPVLPRVGAQRVGELRRAIDAAVGDVVSELPFLRIEVRQVADPFGDFMI